MPRCARWAWGSRRQSSTSTFSRTSDVSCNEPIPLRTSGICIPANGEKRNLQSGPSLMPSDPIDRVSMLGSSTEIVRFRFVTLNHLTEICQPG